jgi:hypothetical protein
VTKERKLRRAGNVAGEPRNAHNILDRKSEGKPLDGRNRGKWEDSIKMELKHYKVKTYSNTTVDLPYKRVNLNRKRLKFNRILT